MERTVQTKKLRQILRQIKILIKIIQYTNKLFNFTFFRAIRANVKAEI